MRLIPHISIAKWGGGDIDGDRGVRGYSLVFQWGPVFIELCGGRRMP